MSERSPTKIGPYVVGQLLGEGAYGQTFLAHDKEQNRFALKVLKDGAARDAATRFANEVWAMKKLEHPAFPKFVAEGVEGERPFIVMTLAEGTTVKSRIEHNIAAQGYYHGLTTLLVAQRMLEGLRYLHGIPLIHRDIKDDNVIVSLSGESVTIIDLGQCKGEMPPKPGQTFWNIGASRFAPPAKLENPSASNKSHDVFGVGVICYRMLTNEYPWEVPQSDDFGHLIRLMRSHVPSSIRDINGIVESELCSLVHAMLEIEDYKRIEVDEALKK